MSEEKEIKEIIGAYAYAQITSLARFIQRRIKYYEADILKLYLNRKTATECMEGITKLLEYFFVLGGRYLHITTDDQYNLVFEFRDESGWHKKHQIIFTKDKIVYREYTTGMGKVLEWEVEFLPVVKAKNKVLEKAPAW